MKVDGDKLEVSTFNDGTCTSKADVSVSGWWSKDGICRFLREGDRGCLKVYVRLSLFLSTCVCLCACGRVSFSISVTLSPCLRLSAWLPHVLSLYLSQSVSLSKLRLYLSRSLVRFLSFCDSVYLYCAVSRPLVCIFLG